MSDLIRREDAIKALMAEAKEQFRLDPSYAYVIGALRNVEDAIRNIPSADRPQGEWIYCEDYVGHDGYECSNCGFFIPWAYDCYADSNFILNYHTCPHCDARMRPKLQGKHFDNIIIDECAMKGADDE